MSINPSILVLSGCECDCLFFFCILYVGLSIIPSGAWAAGVHTCIPSACCRNIEQGDSTTCCFLCSTLGNKSPQMNTAVRFRLSLKVGGQAMQASLVAVGLRSVWGCSLAIDQCSYLLGSSLKTARQIFSLFRPRSCSLGF